MMEFVPHPPWEEYGEWEDWKTTDNPFIRWRGKHEGNPHKPSKVRWVSQSIVSPI
jgi:hypothetical protein